MTTTLVCVRHKATAVSGRWEFHEKELHELNIVGPVEIVSCPKCKNDAMMQREFMRRLDATQKNSR